MFEAIEKLDVFNPQRWGLPEEAVLDLADRLRRTWVRYQLCFKTKTRDTSQYAFAYLQGLLTMETDRNFANIARRVIDLDDDGQNLQQFIRRTISLCPIRLGRHRRSLTRSRSRSVNDLN